MAEPTTPNEESRRRLLERISIVLSAILAGIIGVPTIAFLLQPIFKRVPQIWRSVGPLDKFQPGKTVEVVFEDPAPLPWAGVTARTAAWLRRETGGQFVAFSVNCTHLGCPVRWLADADLFMCPCHGGVYYKDGAVAAGPPPHALFQYEVRVRNGQVEILTSALPIARNGRQACDNA